MTGKEPLSQTMLGSRDSQTEHDTNEQFDDSSEQFDERHSLMGEEDYQALARSDTSPSIATDGSPDTHQSTNTSFQTGHLPGTEILEIAGYIKWFDVSKGFGFIVPDNGLPDIMLHVTCLRHDGFQTAYEGARIVVEALNSPRGLQALRVLSMDESTAVHPAQLSPARTHEQVVPISELEPAQVKWFNRERGFGFLTQGEATPDIFIHMEVLRRFGLTELLPGQMLLMRYGLGSKGRMATEIRPMQNSHIPISH